MPVERWLVPFGQGGSHLRTLSWPAESAESNVIKINKPIPGDEVRLVIFDLDGTLVDSRLDLTRSVNGMLRQFGRPELPLDLIATYVGDGAPMLVRRALGDPEDDAFVKTALEFFLAYYREHKLDTTTVYPGVTEALQAIRSSGATNGGPERQMAVLSNKPVNPSRAIVEALGLGEFFSRIYGGNSFTTKKPDPLGALTLAREYGVEPGQSLIVGDSDVDVLTGRSAGMWTCGVKYGFSPHVLEKAPPDVVVDSPHELPLIFGQQPPEPDDYAEIPGITT